MNSAIIQWNMASYYSNFEELKVLIRDQCNPQVFCLQETRHGTKTILPPSGYNCIQSHPINNEPSARGVCLLINKSINYKTLPLKISGNVEAVAARVWLDKYYSICSIYLSPSLIIQEKDITEILDQLPQPYLLLGDMNARHSLWGEEVNNTKGNLFENLLTKYDISLLNYTDKNHYNTQNNVSTLIDLSVSSASALPDFTATVVECRHGSDHHPIKITKNDEQEVGEPSQKFKTEKADWVKFKNLTENYQNHPQHETIDAYVESITEFILEAAKNSIPISFGGKANKKPIPWWDEECKKIHSERKRAQRALHRVRTLANQIAVRRLNALCRKKFKEKKRYAWRRYVSSINSNTSMNEIWKKINKIRGKFSSHPPPLLKKDDGELTSQPAETAEILADAFSKVSSDGNYTDKFIRHKREEELKPLHLPTQWDITTPYNDEFTMNELKNALSSTQETSPGLDKITYSMIKNTSEKFKTHILKLFNEIYLNNTLPTAWRTAIVIPIPKPNKDHSSPLNFRPISLTSCLCKLMEKMVNNRLVWFLENKNCISNTQAGFKRGRSTTDCIVQFSSDVEQAIINKKHTIAVFFDLQKAYDTAWRRAIIRRLCEFELRGPLLNFISNFLSNRFIKVKINNTISAEKIVPEGIPQGSVLSCNLFAIAIDTVLSKLPPQVKSVLYVDDLTIYASGSNKTVVERQLNMAIRNLEKWCENTGFQFSASKTVSMHLCRVRNCPKASPGLYLNKEYIVNKETHTFLGMLLDNSLRWHKHIAQVKSECIRRLNVLKHLAHTSWGAESQTMIRLYNAIIKPKLEYGAEAYGSSCISNLKKLNPVQNTALRIATGAFRTSPIESLEVITSTKSLSSSRREKLAMYIVRVMANPSNPLNNLLNEDELTDDVEPEDMTLFEARCILNRARKVYKSFEIDQETIATEEEKVYPPWRVTNIMACADIIQNAKRDTPEPILRLIFKNHLQSHTNDNNMTFFTDGSRTQEGVGMSIVQFDGVHPTGSEAHKLHDLASIFTAEMYAILLAITRSENSDKNNITIVSDSKSSIQSILQTYPKHHAVSLIQEKIGQINKNINLCWVPSHIGILGNELADKAAREVIKQQNFLNFPLPRSDICSYIKRKSKENWKDRWKETSEQSNKLRELTDSLTPLPYSSCEIRKWERILTRLRIGHSRLTHKFLILQENPPECDYCSGTAPLTIKHILVECPQHRYARLRAYGRTNPTLTDMLGGGNTSPTGPLAKYLTEIKVMQLL